MKVSHINYDKTIVMVGYGVVAQCLLAMIFRHISLANKIIILDRVDNQHAIPAEFKDKVTFHIADVVQKNYDAIFSHYLSQEMSLLILLMILIVQRFWIGATRTMYGI